jgi:hypothetical protein
VHHYQRCLPVVDRPLPLIVLPSIVLDNIFGAAIILASDKQADPSPDKKENGDEQNNAGSHH